MKTMFGSCTTGIPHEPTTPTSDSSRSSKSRSCEPSEPLSPSREKEEFFYSQFRAKDHSRAEREQAVSAMRERVQATPKTPERKKPSLSKPFPVSSPARKEHPVPPILVREIAPPPTNRSQSEIAGGISFDDGISCLSAHTLDEMARQDDVRKGRRVGTVRSDLMSEGFETIDTIHSKESSLFSPPFSPARINENDDKFGAPIDLTRGNSRNTYSSKKSNGTKSTRSSQTTEFENAWRQDEQIYWQDVVEQDGGDVMGTPEKRREIMRERVEALKERSRAPSSSRSLKGRESALQPLKQNNTPSTAGSSVHSGRHPHETFPFDTTDMFNTTEDDEDIIVVSLGGTGRHCDPDRLREILVMNHETELGEI